MAKIVERIWTTADGTERKGYQVDFVDQEGRRVRKQFKRRKDADTFMVTSRAQAAAGTFTPDSASTTLAKACQLWLDRAEAENLEPMTRQTYREHVAHILAVVDGQFKLSRLTQARSEQLRDDLLRRHSRAMARKLLQSFKSILRESKRRGLVATVVAADTTIGAAKRHKRKIQAGRDFPLPAEMAALLGTGQPKATAAICLAGLAGLRASEVRALRWSDLDLGNKPSVTVGQRADKQGSIGSPKSETAHRKIPLGARAVKALKEWLLAKPHGRELVFGTSSGRPDALTNLQKSLLTPLCAAAGTRRYTWHALRHYAISSWLAARVDLKTAQYWAGHATAALTTDRYGHLIPRDDDHARLEAAEAALG
jgi:integrase